MSNISEIQTIEWLNSGEYLADIDDTRAEIMKGAISSKSEANTASIFEKELYSLIKNKTGIKIDYQKEKPLNNVAHKFRQLTKRKSGKGKLDAIVNNLVIEYKHYSKLETEEQFLLAVNQVKDYLEAYIVCNINQIWNWRRIVI